MIKVEKINKFFGEKHVLNNFSADFDPGKINLIIIKKKNNKIFLIMLLVKLNLYINFSLNNTI